jgi:hypothetical protein
VNLFDLPPSDWSMRQLEVGAAAVAEAAQRARVEHDLRCAVRLQALALVLAEERDVRRRLIAAVEDAYSADAGPV